MNISSLYLTRRVVRTHTQTSPLGVVTAVLRGSISSLMEERKFWEIRRASCRRGKSGWSFGVCFSKSCESTFNHLKMYLPQSNWPLWGEIQILFHLLFENVIALHKHRLLTNTKTILCLGFFFPPRLTSTNFLLFVCIRDKNMTHMLMLDAQSILLSAFMQTWSCITLQRPHWTHPEISALLRWHFLHHYFSSKEVGWFGLRGLSDKHQKAGFRLNSCTSF